MQYSSSQYNLTHAAAVFAGFSSLFILFFNQVVFSGRVFVSDGLLAAFYAPVQLWTPLLYAGFPLQAAVEWQNLYPLRFIFRPLPEGVDFNLFVISAYVLSACFTYGYIYTLTRSIFASAGAGIVFSMSGFMMAHLGHTSMIHAAAWLPLMVWALEKLRMDFSWRWFGIAGLAVAMSILAGHPQIFVYSLLLAGFYVLFRGETQRKFRYWLVCLSALLLGLGLAAVQILPTIELSQSSVRDSMTFIQFISYSLPWHEVFILLFPYLFGHPSAGYGFYGYFGAWSLTEITGYAGILPLLFLTLLAFFSGRYKTLAIFWVIWGIMAFILALGDATPLAALMYQLPVINLFRVPARHFLEMSFAISVLAGLGLDALQRGRLSKTRLFALASAALIVMAGILVWLAIKYPEIARLAASRNIQIPGMLENPAVFAQPLILFSGVVLALVLWRVNDKQLKRLLYAGFLCLLVFDMGVFGFYYEWRFAVREAPEQLEVSPPIQAYSRLLHDSGQRLQPLQGVWQGIFQPNLSYYQNIPSTSGYGPFLIRKYRDFLGLYPDGYVYAPSLLRQTDRRLDILSVRYVVTLDNSSATHIARLVGADDILVREYLAWLDEMRQDSRRWRLADKMGDIEIYQNMNALPRVWLVSELVSAPADQIPDILRTSVLPDGRAFLPEQMALVEMPLAFKHETDPEAYSRIVKLENTRIEIETDSRTPAFLVLSDVFYPGWQAEIDGQATPVFRTNDILRGISLPSGAHRVVFEYQPRAFLVGAGISLLSLLLYLLAGFIVRYRQAKGTKGTPCACPATLP